MRSSLVTPPRKSGREGSVEIMIEPRADGMGAWLVRLSPNAPMTPPSHPNGAGMYYLIVDGEVANGDRNLSAYSVVWVGADETFPLSAGPMGAVVIALQFPADAWKYEVPANIARRLADVRRRDASRRNRRDAGARAKR